MPKGGARERLWRGGPGPLWREEQGQIAGTETTKAPGKETADVVIAGGGIIGISLARALARGGARVTVLDAGEPGAGASAAAAGLLVPQYEGVIEGPLAGLCVASARLHAALAEELREETGIDAEYRSEGLLCPARDEGELRALAAVASACERAGMPAEVLSAEELARREPALGRTRGGLCLPHDHQVDPRRLFAGLLASAQAAGVKVEAGRPVVGVVVSGDRVEGVETSREPIAAPWVVIAAGAWSGLLLRRAGLPPLPVGPVKGEIVCLQTSGEARLHHPIIALDCYLVPRRDGRLLVGSTELEGDFSPGVAAGSAAYLLDAAVGRAPRLASCPVASVWSGLRPAAPDRLPVLGPVGPRGLVIATAHYRKGILLAPETARLLSQVILEDHVPPELAPFSPARFENTARHEGARGGCARLPPQRRCDSAQ